MKLFVFEFEIFKTSRSNPRLAKRSIIKGDLSNIIKEYKKSTLKFKLFFFKCLK